MTIFLIFLLVILVVAMFVVFFGRDMVKDILELQKQPIDKKFEVLIEHLNQGLLYGEGKVALFDDNMRIFNMFSEKYPNRILHFAYYTGHLTIEMGYKFYQQELRFHKQYFHLRDISIFAQKNIARDFIELAQMKIKEHEISVGRKTVSGIKENFDPLPDASCNSDPTQIIDKFYAVLSPEQRTAMICHMLLINSLSNNEYSVLLSNSFVLQLMMISNVSENSCRKMLGELNERQILHIVKSVLEVGHLHIEIHINNCATLVKELAINNVDLEARIERLYSTFSQIGISEDLIIEGLEKIHAFRKYFVVE